MRYLAGVLAVIVALLIVWWATGAEISGATLSTPLPLIIMAGLGALIVAGSIARSSRYQSGRVRARVIAGAVGFVVVGVVLAFQVAGVISTSHGPNHLP